MEDTDQTKTDTISESLSPESAEPGTIEPVKTAPRPRSRWRLLRRALTVSAVLGCLGIGTTIGYLDRTSDIFRVWLHETSKNPGAVLTHPTDPLAAFKPSLQLPPQSQHSLTMLLIGADSDYEEARPVALKNTHGRSDALMVVRVDFDANKIAVLSIPRDTAVFIPNHGSLAHKINAAHAYGGPQLTQQTVESTFGIHTDYFVSINFEAFQKVVNAIGGVDLTVAGPKPLDYDDNWGHLHIHLKPGYQHLDGYKAMGYVRIRHSDDDIHRAARQHEFMEAMRTKIAQPATFLKLPNALNQITQNIDSDLSSAQQLTIANFARSVSKENFAVATLPSTIGRSFAYTNVSESEKLISRLFFADKPHGVKVVVPDQPSLVSRRTLVARATSTQRRSRRKRHRTSVPLHKPTVGTAVEEHGGSFSSHSTELPNDLSLG